jgi:hypothetical protein
LQIQLIRLLQGRQPIAKGSVLLFELGQPVAVATCEGKQNDQAAKPLHNDYFFSAAFLTAQRFF